MKYQADVITNSGFTYVVDNLYPVGGKILFLGEHDLPIIDEIRFLTEEGGYQRVNGDYKTYYYPEAKWGTFHILATDNPAGKNY